MKRNIYVCKRNYKKINMLTYLGYSEAELKSLGGLNTAVEIAGQPDLWQNVYKLVIQQKDDLSAFLKNAITPDTHIILTGAGSSAFIGTVLHGIFSRYVGLPAKAVPSTNLLSHPDDYLNRKNKYLVISFARSGDSPESFGVVRLIAQLVPSAFHLIITCNKDGKLIGEFSGGQVFSLLLPPESNDKGLAMTGSFTSMLLAGLLVARLNDIDRLEVQMKILENYGKSFIKSSDYFKGIANLDFDRAVFLGSGPLLGCAEESHLKLQELTSGKVICKFDSYLGVRHGPRAVINEQTLVINLISNNIYARKYETDLIIDMKMIKSACCMAVSEGRMDDSVCEKMFWLNDGTKQTIDEDFLPVCFILPAQMIGFFKALYLNISPDSPSQNGAISRVVTGVNIYPYKKIK